MAVIAAQLTAAMDDLRPMHVAICAATASLCVVHACVKWTYGYYGGRELRIPSGIPRDTRTTIARVVQLWIYPVKGMRGIQVSKAQMRRGAVGGFLYDRRFLVINADGEFLTQRQLPELATMKTALEKENDGSWYGVSAMHLRLTSKEGESVVLPCEEGDGIRRTVRCWADDVVAEDCGDGVAAFLDIAFISTGHTGLRLVRFAGERAATQKGERRWTEATSFAEGPRGQIFGTAFSDSFPITLCSQESLSSLNDRIKVHDARAAVPMERFRPNIVVAGAEPWNEERWSSFQLVGGGIRPSKAHSKSPDKKYRRGEGVTFHLVKPCSRCKVAATDQRTGELDPRREPLSTLRTMRTGVMLPAWSKDLPATAVYFGIHLVATGEHNLPHEMESSAPTTVTVGCEVMVKEWREAGTIEWLRGWYNRTVAAVKGVTGLEVTLELGLMRSGFSLPRTPTFRKLASVRPNGASNSHAGNVDTGAMTMMSAPGGDPSWAEPGDALWTDPPPTQVETVEPQILLPGSHWIFDADGNYRPAQPGETGDSFAYRANMRSGSAGEQIDNCTPSANS